MGFSSALCDSFKEDAVGEAVLWGGEKKNSVLAHSSFFRTCHQVTGSSALNHNTAEVCAAVTGFLLQLLVEFLVTKTACACAFTPHFAFKHQLNGDPTGGYSFF